MDSDSSPSIEVAVGNGAWRTAVTDPEALVRRAVHAALRDSAVPQAPFEVSIRLTDDAEIQALNRAYRGQDKPTNVLSFPGDDPDGPLEAGQPRLLGDVIVAFETMAAEALAMDRTIEAHLTHLLVHGVLHLLGYDHLADAEATRMEAIEADILAGLGFADPYAGTVFAEAGTAAAVAMPR